MTFEVNYNYITLHWSYLKRCNVQDS